MDFYSFMPRLLNMSITASVVICAVILLRFLLRKAPKVISYALWAAVLFRLLCPVSLSIGISAFSLIDPPTSVREDGSTFIEYVPENIVHTESPAVTLPAHIAEDKVNEAFPQGEEQLRADPLEGPVFIATLVWAVGVLVMLAGSLRSYLRLREKLENAVPLKDNIYAAEGVGSPFVSGILQPQIFLPPGLDEKEREFVILHEQLHIRRFDHVFKLLAFFALTVHWFNPLVWLAFVLASRDMEMSCDEAVIRSLGDDIRADYCASLLSFASQRRRMTVTPLAFGESDTAERIKNLAGRKKPARLAFFFVIAVCIAAVLCLITNPGINEPDLSFLNYKNAVSLAAEQDMLGVIYYPDTGKNGDGLISPGFTSGKDLAKYLGSADWKIRRAPKDGLPSPGSVEFCIGDDYRITVYEKPRVAAVSFMGDIRYYRTGADDFENAVLLLDGSEQKKADEQPHDEEAAVSPENLDDAIDRAVFEHFSRNSSENSICVTSHRVLAAESDPKKNSTTVYVWVLYEEYRPKLEGDFVVAAGGFGSSIPTALTFEIDPETHEISTLLEYWEPSDGSGYTDDIEKRFPKDAKKNLKLHDEFIQELRDENLAKANEAFKSFTFTESSFLKLVDEICSSPAYSSNIADYIAAHPSEYASLLGYGDLGLQYIFRQFLAGGQTGLPGMILKAALDELAPESRLDFQGISAQEYFDEWAAEAERLLNKHGAEWLEKYRPAMALLLL